MENLSFSSKATLFLDSFSDYHLSLRDVLGLHRINVSDFYKGQDRIGIVSIPACVSSGTGSGDINQDSIIGHGPVGVGGIISGGKF